MKVESTSAAQPCEHPVAPPLKVMLKPMNDGRLTPLVCNDAGEPLPCQLAVDIKTASEQWATVTVTFGMVEFAAEPSNDAVRAQFPGRHPQAVDHKAEARAPVGEMRPLSPGLRTKRICLNLELEVTKDVTVAEAKLRVQDRLWRSGDTEHIEWRKDTLPNPESILRGSIFWNTAVAKMRTNQT